LLNDRVIDAVNQLIGQELGVTSQSTLSSQSATGLDAASTDAAVMHAPGHSNARTMFYVDSLRPHQPIAPYVVIQQLLQLFAHRVDDDGKLNISIISWCTPTPQTNWDDCGVFAAAAYTPQR